jgi:DNA polymerase-3 subunit beta
MGADISEEGSITVPARLLTDFVSSLPPGNIELEVSERGKQLKLEQGARNEATMAGMDAQDFPPVPAVADGLTFKLDPQVLRRAIAKVQFAAATDDTRPVLTGIHTLAEANTLKMAAADGFRLAVQTLDLDIDIPEKVEIIIPARALREVERLIGDDTDGVDVSINAGRSQIMFRLPSVEIVATLIQGTFPNYDQLIPSSFNTRAEVGMKEFLQETRIAAIFARDGAGIVRIQMDPANDSGGKMTISARAEEIGNHEGNLEIGIEGEAAKIAFNSRYLQDVLQVLDTEAVLLDTTSPSSPGVLRPKGDDSYVHVVMPMFVQW